MLEALNMEIWKIFILIVIIIIAVCGAICTIHLMNREYNKRIYIYSKTGNRYYAKGIVKMKDSLSNKWVDAVFYVSLKSGYYYVMDKKQFLNKFIILKDWKNE